MHRVSLAAIFSGLIMGNIKRTQFSAFRFQSDVSGNNYYFRVRALYFLPVNTQDSVYERTDLKETYHFDLKR